MPCLTQNQQNSLGIISIHSEHVVVLMYLIVVMSIVTGDAFEEVICMVCPWASRESIASFGVTGVKRGNVLGRQKQVLVWGTTEMLVGKVGYQCCWHIVKLEIIINLETQAYC